MNEETQAVPETAATNEQPQSNVKRADFLQAALQKASGAGASPKFDATAACANLAMHVVDIQRDLKNFGGAIGSSIQSLNQVIEGHNKLAQKVEELWKKVFGEEPK